jgi:uncharacterized protein YpmB
MSMKEIVLAIAYVLSIFVALICSSCVGYNGAIERQLDAEHAAIAAQTNGVAR